MSKSFFQRYKPTTLHRLATAASLFALCRFSGCSNDDDTLPAGSGTGGNSAATTAVAPTTGTPTNNQNSGITTTATGSNPSAAVTSGLTTTNTTSSPSTNTTSTDTKNPGNAPALEELVAAACGWGERCCDAQEFRYIYGTDVATCTLEVLSAINSGPSPKSVGQLSYASKFLVDLVGTIDLDRAQLSPENAKACLTHLRERTCLAPTSDKSSCDPKAAKDPCALSKIFVGTIPIAGPCDPAVNEAAQGEVQCAPGARCELDPTQSNLPRCVVKAQAGQACIVTSSVESNCDAGLFCSDKTGTCTKHAQAGEVCAFADAKAPFVGTETIPCAAGLSCSAQTLRCVSSCEASSRCGLATKGTEVAAQNADLSLCAEGLSCVPTLITAKGEGREQDADVFSCEAPRGAEGACDSDRDCNATSFCKKSKDAALGKCSAKIAKDATGCEGQDARCLSGNFCADNTCRAKIKAGSDQACQAHNACDEASIGCVGTDAESRRCITAPLAKAAKCDADYGATSLPAAQFARLGPVSGAAITGVSDFRYWANYCESRVCDLGQCTDGAKEGEACDLLLEDNAKPSCAFGLQCLSGVCRPLLTGGALCKAESSPDVAACHYDLQGGAGNENACKEVGGEFRCGLRVRNSEGSYCDGK